MRATVVIPARMASTRLPGKPLALIAGEPMIVHVWRRAMEAGIGDVLVACAEKEIKEAVGKAGGEAVMTEPDLPSGSDRVFAALQAKKIAPEIVVNLQGDLPAIRPDDLRTLLKTLHAEEPCDIGTLAAPITSDEELHRPQVVKAVLGGRSWLRPALYFSRLPVPYGEGPHWHHIGVYAYRYGALQKFVRHPATELEQREKLEQLRALEMGLRMKAAIVDHVPLGVDTPEDLAKVKELLE